ncbi:hypothetical protein RINTHH_9350 [Richelia intracellularis HH01]|jgi:hypothetical protein|uniref:Uncharacterized protein n=1 Tax=Richelia intracellularis HH01 TaxID=1165094 RepID=M1X2M6_9NOST|nr:hypothetical protein RINTHH_9350 [Richelia intracellularis HH01]
MIDDLLEIIKWKAISPVHYLYWANCFPLKLQEGKSKLSSPLNILI